MKNKVKRTERGWAGHYICANSCRFRRNTLLEYGDIRIVVSSVGLQEDPRKRNKFLDIGAGGRKFETVAFHAKSDGRYWDADVEREICFKSPWAIMEFDADDKANDMHEKVVEEISNRLVNGDVFEGLE